MVELSDHVLGCNPDRAASRKSNGIVGSAAHHIYPFALLKRYLLHPLRRYPHDTAILAPGNNAILILRPAGTQQAVIGL